MFGEPQKLKDALAAYVEKIMIPLPLPDAIDPQLLAVLQQQDQRLKNIEDFLLGMKAAGF